MLYNVTTVTKNYFEGIFLYKLIIIQKVYITMLLYLLLCKKEGKDQESIQSSTTTDLGYQWESDNFFPAKPHK